MQLSTSTSAPDSSLLPLLPALPGASSSGDAVPGAFEEFMPATAPMPPPDIVPPAAPLLPLNAILGGLVVTSAAAIPVTVAAADSKAPAVPVASPVTGSGPSTRPPASLLTGAAVLVADPADDPQPARTSSATRPAATRGLPAAPPMLRSARAVSRVEPALGENILPAQLSPAPFPADVHLALALPIDPVPPPVDDSASDATNDTGMSAGTPTCTPVARAPWIMPAAQPVSATLHPAQAEVEVTATTPIAPFGRVTVSAETAPLASVRPDAVPANRPSLPPGVRPTAVEADVSFGVPLPTALPAEIPPARSAPTSDRPSVSASWTAPAFTPAAELTATAALPQAAEFFGAISPTPTLATAFTLKSAPAPVAASVPAATPAPATEDVVENPFASTVIPPVENRVAPRFSTRAEKFAAPRSEIFTPRISRLNPPDENFLSAVDKEVNGTSGSLGIDVAKSPSTMSAPATSPQFTAASPAVLDVNVVAAPMSGPPSAPAAAPATTAEITAAAHKAVDAVLASTERLTGATHSSVNLKFSVGGADLDVRVEVRAGAVHATFRTDSPELRTALAQEWQTTNSQPADHSLRLAPPVFAAGDRSGTGAGSFGEQSQQARDQGARPSSEFVLPGAVRTRLASASSPGAGVSALPARSVPATTLHLHAFA